MKTLACLLTLLITVHSAHALETDQYMVWGNELKDSTAVLNQYYNDNFKRAVERINADPKLQALSCQDATVEVLKEYHAFWWGERLENWILDNSDIQKIPEYSSMTRLEAIGQSIYRDVFKFKFKIFGFNIKIGGVNLGIDKMGHLSSVGLSYYQRYLKYSSKLKQTNDHILQDLREFEHSNSSATGENNKFLKNPNLAAVDKVIGWGIYMENWGWGYAVSDTFSYADLEANYQGFLLALNFCQGDNPYMKKEDGVLKINSERPIDLSEYINPSYDESYNPSHYQKRIFKKIRPHLEKYCDLRNSPEVLSLFNSYDQQMQKNGESYSQQYTTFLRSNKKSSHSKKYFLNSPERSKQTLDFVCRH